MEQAELIETEVKDVKRSEKEPEIEVLGLPFSLIKELDVEKLEKLIELRNKQDERIAKIDFDEHFVEVKAKLPAIARNKQGDKSKYAPIDEMQRRCDPIIAEGGFAYWWDEIDHEDGSLTVVMTISGYGYQKTTSKKLPAYEPDKGSQSGKAIMNPLQAEGTRSSYGRRYTFISGWGLIVEDEDTDANFEDGVTYGQYIQLIRESQTLEELKAHYKTAWTNLQGDDKGKKIIVAARKRRGKELGE